MAGDQDFLEDSVITQLDNALDAEGVTNRTYGVVGYGSISNGGDPRLITDGTLDDAATTKTNLGSLVDNGGTEDGFEAIKFAIDNLSFVAGAAINFILVTDEDRDNTSSDTKASILAELTKRNILLNVIVSNPFTSDNYGSGDVLGINDSGEAFYEQALGLFGTDTGGTAGNGAGTTEDDYVDLALKTGGAAWNINLLRAGGNTTDSFASAFIDIKVGEITTQPPSGVIPVPAGLPLILTGFGILGAFGARRKKKAAV